MPTINKIRIVNYAYNDDKRLIIDETFEYHGKNGLMNLINGGGKTVLIQAIMQPFIPLSKLGKREFEELFRKDKEPSYILIEWRLDNNNGFMTNGIAIKRSSSVQEDENSDKSDKFDYFTFILESAKSSLNIKNLKLSDKLNDKVTFMNYHEVKNFINKSGGHTYDKSSEVYKKTLNSFRIDTKEWRNVIAKINSEEGGLLKLFDKCNTSNDLMRDWILKSIKENLAESTNMPDLLEQTEKHIINSRQKIEDKQKRKDLILYTEDLEKIKSDVNKLKDINDKTNAAKTELSNLLCSLTEHISEKEEEVKNIENDKDNINERLNEIKIEELSSQYYHAFDNKKEMEDEKFDITIELKSLNMQLTDCERLIKSLKVADLTKQRLDKEKELEDVTVKLATLSQAKGDIDQQIEDLGFTIKNLYEEKIVDFNKQIENINEELSENSKEQKALKSKQESVSQEYLNLEVNISSLRTKVNTISERIDSLVNDINPSNIFIGLDKDATNKEKNIIDTKTNFNSEAINRLTDEKENAKEKIKVNSAALENLIKDKSYIENQITINKKELEQYYKELSNISNQLNLYDIEKFSAENREGVLNLIDDKITSLSNNIAANNAVIIKNKEMLEKLLSGGIKINKDFIKYLNDKGIVYVLGSDYIKESMPAEDERRKAIETNTLLPFAIILEEKSIKYIHKDMPEIYSDSPIIVIERETLNDINMPNINGYLEIARSIGILSLYNKELVVKKDIEKERNTIKAEISRLKEESDNWDSQKSDLILIRGQVENFTYNEDYEKDTARLIQSLTEDAKSKGRLFQEIKDKNIELDNAIMKKENEIKEKEQNNRELKILAEKCDELIIFITHKEKFCYEINGYNSQLKESKREKDELGSRIQSLSQREMDLKVVNSKLEGKVNIIKSNQQSYLCYVFGNTVEGTLELLEQRYKSLQSKIDRESLNDYRRRESNIINDIRQINDRIGKFSGFDIVEYEFGLENETDDKIKSLNQKITKLSSEIAVLNNKINLKEKLMDSILEKIKPDTLRERYAIGTSLQEEKDMLNKKIEAANVQINNIRTDLSECNKVFNRVNDSGHLLGFSKVSPDIFSEEYIADKIKIFENNNTELIKLNKEEDYTKNIINNKTDALLINHSRKNATIDNSISCLKQEVVNNISVELYDIIERQINIIEMLLDKIKTDLEVLEKEEKYITERYLDVSRQYTDEINKIDKNSYITIQGKRLRMMRIKNIRQDESSPVNLTVFIKRQLETIANNLQIIENDLVKAINREFNIENLLINYCSLNHVRIYFLKIEDNILLSSERPWEEVTTNNSGGEKFVSYFVLFSTLINYERRNHLNKESVSMCLIMDNPFAAISSKHLLIPLFEFAKKNNIQLICFTDHNKADILDRFDVIHKLVVKTLVNNKEFISSEKVKDNFEVMDDGYFYYNEQTSFL